MTAATDHSQTRAPTAVYVGTTAYPLAVEIPVTRSGEGYWTHPALPTDTPGSPQFAAWVVAQVLETASTSLHDEPEEHAVVRSYFVRGESDISAWEPLPPVGEGWFLLAVEDSDVGPECLWARRVAGAPSADAGVKG